MGINPQTGHRLWTQKPWQQKVQNVTGHILCCGAAKPRCEGPHTMWRAIHASQHPSTRTERQVWESGAHSAAQAPHREHRCRKQHRRSDKHRRAAQRAPAAHPAAHVPGARRSERTPAAECGHRGTPEPPGDAGGAKRYNASPIPRTGQRLFGRCHPRGVRRPQRRASSPVVAVRWPHGQGEAECARTRVSARAARTLACN